MITITKEKFDVQKHFLVPKQTKLSDKDKKSLLEQYNITLDDLPRITMTDTAISHLDVTTDDVIKVERASPTTKNTVFYRRVVK